MRVQILESSVAEKIAAGEVIERPASIVKELVENSLDAGATEISISLESGGVSLIEVLDNGSGIHPDDLAICVQRHATSKISTFKDLEQLSTLGFRGEALPSISAVAELSMISKIKENESSYEWKANTCSPVTFGHFLGSSHGTKVTVRGLFSQIPARLKFLKSQPAEVSQIRDCLERIALSKPNVGVSLFSDGKEILNFRPKSEVERVREILTDDQDYPILCESLNDSTRIYWAQGLSLSHSRKLYQLINQRTVKDKLLHQAIMMPFKQSLLPGQFPAVVLFLEEPASQIDFNVHPTKSEVRFLDSRRIFQTIESLVTVLIKKNGSPVIVPGGLQPSSITLTAAEQSMPAFQAQEFVAQTLSFSSTAPTSTSAGTCIDPNTNEFIRSNNFLSYGRKVGHLFETYILYDMGEELAMVDQHAADERVRYERLRKRFFERNKNPSIQTLLIPEAVKLSQASVISAQVRLPWFEKLGFEVEVFGEETLLFRGIPAEWGTKGLRHRLQNLVDRVLSMENLNSEEALFDERLFEALASEACHSAVRAGDDLESIESTVLVDQLFQCEHPWNCPHGRPTVVRVPKTKLEEWFQRKV